MTDWDKLIEETTAIARKQRKESYDQGYRWGMIDGYYKGHKDSLDQMKEAMGWTT